MASLADKAILSGAENRPPMLEKDMYDSWRSRMEMYMLNKQHGRIILESVEHGVEKPRESAALSDSDGDEEEDLTNKPIGPVDPSKCTATGIGVADRTACSPSSFVVVTKPRHLKKET
nr:serine/arginine repetitive matrix protein 2-like [Tanacetum cinerariifolium]